MGNELFQLSIRTGSFLTRWLLGLLREISSELAGHFPSEDLALSRERIALLSVLSGI